MRKTIILGIALLGLVGQAMAAGKWEPQVKPADCFSADWKMANKSADGFIYMTRSDCMEVINRGYAKGVNVNSIVTTADGKQKTVSGFVSPTQRLPAGVTFTSFTPTGSWAR